MPLVRLQNPSSQHGHRHSPGGRPVERAELGGGDWHRGQTAGLRGRNDLLPEVWRDQVRDADGR